MAGLRYIWGRPCAFLLETEGEADVELAAGEVVGDGVLDLVHVGHPVVAAHVGNVEEVEHVHAYPDVLEVAQQAGGGARLSAHELVGDAHVHSLVGRGAEVALVARGARSGGGQAVGVYSAQAEFHLGKLGKVVGEKQGYAITLVGGARHFHPVKVLLRLHQRQAYPRVGSLNELTEEFHVDARHVALRAVHARVGQFKVVDFVWHKVRQVLVVKLGREAEGAVHGAECIVAAQYQVYAALRAYVAVQNHVGVASFVGLLHAVFLVERSLVIQSGGKAQRYSLVSRRHEPHTCTGAYKELAVEVPVSTPHAAIEGDVAGIVHYAKSVLRIER